MRQTWRSRRDTKITRRNNKSKEGETAEWRMVDGAERDRGSRKGKKEAWNVSPVGEGSCVKGNSKFTGGVLAEADEKFRENNEKIKRRNVCTHVASLGRFFHPSPTCPAFMHRATLPLFLPPSARNVGSSRPGRGGYRNCK